MSTNATMDKELSQAQNEECEYLRVEVTRTESSELYLKVPKGWRPSGRDYKLMGIAAEEIPDYDWDNFGWEDTIEVQGYEVVGADEAKFYDIFDVCPHLKAETSVSESK